MAHRVWQPSGLALICSMMLIMLVTGCAQSGQPRPRLGSLPYPGMLNLYESVDVESMSDHSYGWQPFIEGDRGIVYTERGGFIDISHVRWTIDWAVFYRRQVSAALTDRATRLTLPTNKRSRLHMRFNYPDDWDAMPAPERERLINELSLRIGQEAAWHLGAWHEIATYYGYASWVVISEKRSAFTYDDTFSHVLGLHVLEAAVQSGEREFGPAVTTALQELLESLEPRSPEGTREAAYAVEDRWWAAGKPLRRYMDVPLPGETVRPWLVPQSPGEPGRLGEAWRVPGLIDVEQGAYMDLVRMQFEPRIMEGGSIRSAAGIREGRIDPYMHFEKILEDIRREVLDEGGPDAVQP